MRLILVLGGLPQTKQLQDLYAALTAELTNVTDVDVIVVDPAPWTESCCIPPRPPLTWHFIQQQYNDYLTDATLTAFREKYSAIAVVDELLWKAETPEAVAKRQSCINKEGALRRLCALITSKPHKHTWWQRGIEATQGESSSFCRLSNIWKKEKNILVCGCLDALTHMIISRISTETRTDVKTFRVDETARALETISSLFDASPWPAGADVRQSNTQSLRVLSALIKRV